MGLSARGNSYFLVKKIYINTQSSDPSSQTVPKFQMAVHVSSKMSGERWCNSKEHSSYFHNEPENKKSKKSSNEMKSISRNFFICVNFPISELSWNIAKRMNEIGNYLIVTRVYILLRFLKKFLAHAVVYFRNKIHKISFTNLIVPLYGYTKFES